MPHQSGFSVLQSVYKKDNPAFFSESLQSIADNTLLPEEIVLVKDGELTPQLEDVIHQWQDKLPLRVVGYERNQGLGFALNYGLQFVKTDLVARMDSDDICFPDRFEKQVLRFEIDPALEILGGGIEEFYVASDGKETRRIRLYPKTTEEKSPSLYKGIPLAHPTLMVKTVLLKDFRYSVKTRCNEDLELYFRLLRTNHTIKTIQEPLLRFRITDATFSRRSFSKAWCEYKFYSRNLREIHGFSKNDLLPLLRLVSRMLPKSLNKRLYMSQKRNNLFKEDIVKLQYLSGKVFVKNGHVFSALFQFEENGEQLIKAVQLDGVASSQIEIPLSQVTLLSLPTSCEVQL